jgi:hypothetical protein
MKRLIKIIAIIIIGLLVYSCNDFLERIPKDELTIESTFANYETIKTYAWQFYEVFEAYGAGSVLPKEFETEFDGDLMAKSRKNSYSEMIWQTYKVPTSSILYSNPFSYIRGCNLMLDNLDKSTLSDVDKNHWRSVAYFFKAFNYAELINKYGDITWVEHTLNEDADELHSSRTSRDIVAAKILELLKYAEANINPGGKTDVDGINTVNLHVVRALISRFGLREGTWRKYHGLTDANTYLDACVSASEKLIVDFPKIMSDYSKVFCSESLQGAAGIILYKQYVKDVIVQATSFYPGSSNGYFDLTRKAIDTYLMKDGQTRWTSPLFQGDDGYYKEFRNRDSRLYYTTPAPYKVIAPGVTSTYTYTGNPEDREFIDLLNSLTPDGTKSIPMRAWSGPVVQKVPHFSDNNGGQTWSITLTGYQFTKFWTRLNEGVQQCTNDAPIFRIEEVMLNYAEAEKELGIFNQSICDQTINKLRTRGGVASLNLSNIPDDPTRDLSVDPVMWEIRRERAVELMGEGFRFNDLRRWKKMDYALERKLGRYIVAADENNKVSILNGANQGYVSYEGQAPTPFPDYYYLYPIPSNEIILSGSALIQNPGWK